MQPRTATRLGLGVLHFLLLFCLLAASGCAWLDDRQRQLIYRPTPGLPDSFAGLGAGDARFFLDVPQANADNAGKETPADDQSNGRDVQRVELWWLPNVDPSAPTLLYLHGTFRTLVPNLRKIEALREAGYSVLALEYRGWGLSTPITPSEQTLMQDADVAWAELQRREPRAPMRVLYGHSMGSGVAVDLASRLRAPSDYGGLILESAFTSFPEVALTAGRVAWLFSQTSNERFASVEKIARVHVPLLMIHGSDDTTIPLQLGEKLFDAANPPKQWLRIEGGRHSNLDQAGREPYQQALQRFRTTYLAAPDSAPGHDSPCIPTSQVMKPGESCPAAPR